jgi:hypothetical protein
MKRFLVQLFGVFLLLISALLTAGFVLPPTITLVSSVHLPANKEIVWQQIENPTGIPTWSDVVRSVRVIQTSEEGNLKWIEYYDQGESTLELVESKRYHHALIRSLDPPGVLWRLRFDSDDQDQTVLTIQWEATPEKPFNRSLVWLFSLWRNPAALMSSEIEARIAAYVS